MSKVNNSVLKVNGVTVNGVTSSNTFTITDETLSGVVTIGNGANFQPLNFDPPHVDTVWSAGSRSVAARNVSEIESVTNAQWVTLLRKHIKLFVTDRELTDFLMEDSLKDK